MSTLKYAALFLNSDALPPPDNMADYVSAVDYSRREIEGAGDFIRGKNSYGEEAIQAFKIAHRWRDSYRYPMMRLRTELRGKLTRMGLEGSPVARLKRMQSIRQKLAKTNYTLYQLQDIAGVRTILPTQRDVDAVIASYRAGECQQRVHREWPYIDSPKSNGYRCHHIVFKFLEGDWARQFIELQIRTQLQHSWATAVEAVGTVRGENMKGGEGNREWLRLFEIMSAEFAIEERRPTVPGVSDDEQKRRKELADLEERLEAVHTLETFRAAIKFTDTIDSTMNPYFLVQYDLDQRTVRVSTYNSFAQTADHYVAEEEKERRGGRKNTVLVEVDKVDDLKAAFPNYFMDVAMFANRLKTYAIYKGRPATDLRWLKFWKE